MSYEVEIRVYFNSYNECFNTIPGIEELLQRKVKFRTVMYGIDLFKEGKILRVSYSEYKNTKKVLLGYKEKDIGKEFNIREEFEEDLTLELKESFIIRDFLGENLAVNMDNIYKELEKLKYKEFMILSGTNLVGNYKESNVDLKLMSCKELKYPLLLELERIVQNLDEIQKAESDLKKFIDKYNLHTRVVKAEPPYLLK